jgi:hypothetical protein
MVNRTPKSLVSRVSVLLLVFSIPLFAPSSPEGDAYLPGAPTTAQAIIPTTDITQVFGHLGQFGAALDQIAKIRSQYELVRDNFRKISQITGWEPLNDFFKPVDDFLDSTFDPAFGAMRTLSDSKMLDHMETTFKTYFTDEGPGTTEENKKNMTEYALKMGKSMLMEPAVANNVLTDIQERKKSIDKCISNSKGRKSMNHCMAELETMGLVQNTRLNRALARQTALIATQGLKGDAAQKQRREIVNILRDQTHQEIFKIVSKKKTEAYQSTPRMN